MSGHEGPRRGRRVAQVAARHARAGQAHLAGLAVRHRLETVEHVAAHAVDGKPDRAAAPGRPARRAAVVTATVHSAGP